MTYVLLIYSQPHLFLRFFGPLDALAFEVRIMTSSPFTLLNVNCLIHGRATFLPSHVPFSRSFFVENSMNRSARARGPESFIHSADQTPAASTSASLHQTWVIPNILSA